MSTQAKIEKMLAKSEKIIAAGGPKRVAKQHEGAITAPASVLSTVFF